MSRILRPRTQTGWDFLTQGRKPNAPSVVVNSDSDLSRGLNVLIPITGTRPPIDLVSGQQMTIVGSAVVRHGPRTCELYAAAVNSGFQIPVSISATQDFTIFCVAYSNNATFSTRKRAWRISDASGTLTALDYFGEQNTSARCIMPNIRNQAGAFETYYWQEPYGPGKFYSSAWIKNGTNYSLYANKRYRANAFEATNPFVGDHLYANPTTLTLCNNAVTSSLQLIGGVEFFAIWNRVLSAAELRKLESNPLQLVRSANDADYFTRLASQSTVTLSNLTFASRTATSITPRLDVTVS